MTAELEAAFGRILVVGAGAVGLLYAGLLSAVAPGRVTLITRRADTVDGLRILLTVIRPDGTSLQIRDLDIRLAQECGPDLEGAYDIAFIAVSAYDTGAVAPLADRLLTPAGLAITLQNGLDNRDRLAETLGEDRAVQGSTSFSVHRIGPDSIQMTNQGITCVPALPDPVMWLERWLGSAGLAPTRIDDPVELVWRKMAIGTNSYMSLILASPLGKVVKCPSVRDLAELASLETVEIAKACGIALDGDAILHALRSGWGKFSEDARSSFYSDYIAGKRTELEDRFGSLLKRAAAANVATPALRIFYLLCKARLELQGRSE